MILLMLWYYEIAIRQIKSNLIKMVAAIRAAFHIALSKEDWHYPHCQEGKDNWCRYHQDRVNGTNKYIQARTRCAIRDCYEIEANICKA